MIISLVAFFSFLNLSYTLFNCFNGMAFWPRDQRTISSTPAESVRKQSRNYPNLEQGLIGAATLSEDRNKRLSWIFASKTPNDVDST